MQVLSILEPILTVSIDIHKYCRGPWPFTRLTAGPYTSLNVSEIP